MMACAPGEIAMSVISFCRGYPWQLCRQAAHARTARGPSSPSCRWCPWDEAAAREYARLPFRRARFDRLLAAHALSIGAMVVTANGEDFARCAGVDG